MQLTHWMYSWDWQALGNLFYNSEEQIRIGKLLHEIRAGVISCTSSSKKSTAWEILQAVRSRNRKRKKAWFVEFRRRPKCWYPVNIVPWDILAVMEARVSNLVSALKSPVFERISSTTFYRSFSHILQLELSSHSPQPSILYSSCNPSYRPGPGITSFLESKEWHHRFTFYIFWAFAMCREGNSNQGWSKRPEWCGSVFSEFTA